jgi:hypothetical protein
MAVKLLPANVTFATNFEHFNVDVGTGIATL